MDRLTEPEFRDGALCWSLLLDDWNWLAHLVFLPLCEGIVGASLLGSLNLLVIALLAIGADYCFPLYAAAASLLFVHGGMWDLVC